MRITIKDIAKEFDIHHSTVSRALRDDPRINPETKNKIRQYAEKHGYRVNMNAANFRANTSNVVALIIPKNTHRFFSNIVYYLTNLAYDNNIVISIFQTNESYEQECRIVEKIIQQNMAGVIASISNKTETSDHFSELLDMEIPLVFFDRILKDLKVSTVVNNNREALFKLTCSLIESGRKRIAHLTGPEKISVFNERIKGYYDAVNLYDLDYKKQIIFDVDFSMEGGQKIIKELFGQDNAPDAIISNSSFLTIGIVRQLKDEHIEIPTDLALAGFGDHFFNEMLHPGIISVEQPEEEMANEVFKLLLDQLDRSGDSGKASIQNIMLESKIIMNQRLKKIC